MTGKRRTVPQTVRWDQLTAEHAGRELSVHVWWDPDHPVPFTFDHTDGETGGPVPAERDPEGEVVTWRDTVVHYLRWPDGAVGGVSLPTDSQVELL